MKDNIVLIGMPGVGKSTVGVILAKTIGMNFVDTDLVIQEKEKKLLREIIAEKGVDGFLNTEETIVGNVDVSNSVIATGGSVVYGKKAMQHLKDIGTVVYLKLSLEAVSARLSDIKGRGVVLKPGQTFEALYDERVKLYADYADITIDEEGLSIEQTVEMTTSLLNIKKKAGK